MNTNYVLKYFEYLLKRLCHYFITDRNYREYRFYRDFKFRPNKVSPKTFNEKIMYRMLMQRSNPIFTQLADKYQARAWVREHAGSQYLIPLCGIFSHADKINFSLLPKKFVLKCNHDCGSVVICLDKEKFDKYQACKKLAFRMKRNQYYSSREWQYRDIKPRIMCEEYVDLSDEWFDGYRADIYRVHCFEGRPVWLEVEYVEFTGIRHSCIYDITWTLQPVLMGYPNPAVSIPAPLRLPELLDVATKLTQGIDYCRADFYVTYEQILFSEFTFSPSNGREIFTPQSWDQEFGKLWKITEIEEPN
ncbi:ATP-grasp fold amidoligase family protein [Rahnella variigena]|uniref:ATP-grasp fold amidoligase family protein n=1 Tax=Rahnella variigena TaxID=574964 RepID=UPI001330D88A|nr:ATP-grasp fold amidoligase family protein [Rahnella variigena]